MKLHLFWLDKNWKKKHKGAAEHYNLLVDFETKTYKVYINPYCNYQLPDDIEVAKKTDIMEYKEYLIKNGFKPENNKEENTMTKEQRKQIVMKALKVNKEDAKRIVKHLTEQDCIEWIDKYTEDGKDEPLTDVHYEKTFNNMIDWQYEDSKPSEMLDKPSVIEEYPEMLQLKDSVIFWYGLV